MSTYHKALNVFKFETLPETNQYSAKGNTRAFDEVQTHKWPITSHVLYYTCSHHVTALWYEQEQLFVTSCHHIVTMHDTVTVPQYHHSCTMCFTGTLHSSIILVPCVLLWQFHSTIILVQCVLLWQFHSTIILVSCVLLCQFHSTITLVPDMLHVTSLKLSLPL